MKLILLEDVDRLGKKGSVVQVKDGYGRNFLIPRKMAAPANESNLRSLEFQKKQEKVRDAKEEVDAGKMKEQLERLSFTISMKAGEGDVLFGSVTSADIAELLEKEGYSIDKRRIGLDEPIKRVGDYRVSVKLFRNVAADLKVSVVKDET